jgi:hypothetical protein
MGKILVLRFYSEKPERKTQNHQFYTCNLVFYSPNLHCTEKKSINIYYLQLHTFESLHNEKKRLHDYTG